MRAAITAVGHFTPEERLTNQDLEGMVDTNDTWITTRTGIKERRILGEGKGTSHMAVEAGRMVLEERGISPESLDLILLATVTPDMPVPSTAALVQKQLGAANAWGFDINGGCTGFICALATGSQFIETGRYQRILVVGADKMSAIIDYGDRNTCVIFGDGAGAVLLEPSPEADLGIADFELRTDGAGAEYLHVAAGGSLRPASHETVAQRAHCVYQDGRTVYKHAVTGMSEISAALLRRNHLAAEDVDHLIPHQANIRIIDAVSKKLGLEPSKVVVNIATYGNTTAATIPLAMSEAHQKGMMSKGDRILISAFGAGFTWGSLLFRWALG